MSELIVIFTLLDRARAQQFASHELEVKASRLAAFWVAVGECRAYRVLWQSYLRDLEHAEISG